MTSETQPSSGLSARQRRSNQIKLLILWLVPFGLMTIAGVCYYLVMTGQLQIGSKNKGDLIVPAFQVGEVFGDDGSTALTESLQGKWSIVHRVQGDCEQSCREALMQSRQIHIRLDKEANRVQRVLLVDKPIADLELLELLESQHSLLKVLSLEAMQSDQKLGELDQLLSNTVAATKTPIEGDTPALAFFLVDQNGFAMMAYHQGHPGNDILQDLKHLLKYSRQR